ncbi:MAG: sigma 54-interacting transcriptional regulator [Deltaproteobacteria bacterium]|nr:sigma 54-interacting transcriptional regulator [Deltaproteobacteria bacterium]
MRDDFVSGDRADKTRRAPTVERAIHLSQCKLVVIKGAARGHEYVLSADVVRLGKAETNDIVMPEDTVSRVHCEILRDQRGYLLRDLDSTNGTFLDGAEVREAYLRAGSVLTVGTVQLRFQPFEQRIEILPSEKERLGSMVGRSLAMREIFGLIERVGPTEATVLIEGETGVGKDQVARTVHDCSRRKDKPFVVVDCGAVAGNLIESELFGHEKGAYTGATATRQGAFEMADGGTIFLDELGELSLDLQPKLLRVLESREFRRVGGNRTIRVDIRVIAATKQDLRSEVQKGKFREDLYFRLSVVPIYVPPLRERKEDVAPLINEFIKKLAPEGLEMTPEALDGLVAHDWPGNVRELRNVLERGMYLSKQVGSEAFKFIDATAMGFPRPAGGRSGVDVTFDPTQSYRTNKERWNDDFERRYLTWLLQRSQGNISRAAREADMDRKYLHKLIKKHGIS